MERIDFFDQPTTAFEESAVEYVVAEPAEEVVVTESAGECIESAATHEDVIL